MPPFFALAQITGPDIGGLIAGFLTGMRDLLQTWANELPAQAAAGGIDELRQFYGWFSVQGMSFVVRTPTDLILSVSNQMGVGNVRPLLESICDLAIVVGAVAYAGHAYFGWPGLGETFTRIGITIVLVGSSLRIEMISLDMINSMVDSMRVSFPGLPAVGGDVMIAVALLLPWIWFSLRLVKQMGHRITWLAILYPFGPLANCFWAFPQTRWLATQYWKLWWGWLIGQLLVNVCLVAAGAFVAMGGPAGYLLSLSALGVAYDAVHIFAPKDGSVHVSVGVGPLRLPL